MIKVDYDSNFRILKLDDLLVSVPRAIVVNKFTEDSALRFANEIAMAKNSRQPVIPIIIDSYGGEVYSLLSMIDSIHSVGETPVATIVTGKAMSCGAVLFSQGTEGYRYIAPHASLMVHDVSGGAFGKTEDINVSAKEISRLNDMIYALMAKGTGKKDAKYYWKIVHQKGRTDWHITPEEAKKHNLANNISCPSLKIKLSYNVEFS